MQTAHQVIPFEVASWILGAVAVIGFLLIGRRVWWAWYINAFVQLLWVVYWVFIGKNPGPIITNVVYIMVFAQNSIKWSREFHTNKNVSNRNQLSRFLNTKGDIR